jgi:hypothetical protein
VIFWGRLLVIETLDSPRRRGKNGRRDDIPNHDISVDAELAQFRFSQLPHLARPPQRILRLGDGPQAARALLLDENETNTRRLLAPSPYLLYSACSVNGGFEGLASSAEENRDIVTRYSADLLSEGSPRYIVPWLY